MWWICSPDGATVPQHIQHLVKIANDDAIEGDESMNHINKIPLVLTGNEGVVHIDKLPHDEHPKAVIGSGDATDRSAGRLVIFGNGTRSVRYHLIALQSQRFSLQRSLDELSANRAEDRIISTRQYQTLNANLKRIAIQTARKIVSSAAIVTVIDDHNNNSSSATSSRAILSPNPRTLHLLWEEYQHGISGRKAAKSFTSQECCHLKHNYVRQKIVWDLVSSLVRDGYTFNVVIDQIYQVYGVQSSVTTVINRLKKM
jgi:hypothetical protein